MQNRISICAGALFAACLATAPSAGFATPATPAEPNADPNIAVGGFPGTSPNLITTPGSFSVEVNGSMDQQQPLLILVGAYDNNLGGGTPQISEAACGTAPLHLCSFAPIGAGSGTYGLSADTATFTNTPGKDIAETNVGLTGDGSENFTNWSAADVANGLAAPTDFQLYVFAVPISLAAMTPISLDYNNLAKGSFIIAFDCDNTFGSDSGCASGHEGQTPFTTAGFADVSTLVIATPEPGSLALLGTALAGFGLAGFGWLGYRRR